MPSPIAGIVPVMLTPFTEQSRIDWDGYQALIEWYLDKGADALFAVCQSSEMQFLSLAERVALARFTVEAVDGRVPVIASGHIADALDEQLAELQAIGETGLDALVLVTNRLAPADADDDRALLEPLRRIMATLPPELPLGLYECPAPYRRLLSDEEVRFCAESGRFVFLKDVSCDLSTVTRRLALAAGSPLAVVNANAAIAWPALRAGSPGFCGVFNNFHPDLYKWLSLEGAGHQAFAEELAVFLALASMAETKGYPAIAKLYHQRLGTFRAIACRAIDYDIRTDIWALDSILDRIAEGTELYRDKLARLQQP